VEPPFDRRDSPAKRRRWRRWRTGWRYWFLSLILPPLLVALIQYAIQEAFHDAREAYWARYVKGVVNQVQELQDLKQRFVVPK
jgi:hypothetical protein